MNKQQRPQSRLAVLDIYLLKVESILALLGGIAVFLLLILAVISVAGRNFFNSPLNGYIDWIEQIMPLIAFIGISFAFRWGSHIRMDILIRKLNKRSLWAVEFITVFFILLLMVLMLFGSSSHFLRSFDFTAPLWSRDSSMDIGLPIWPAKLIVPIAFFILCLRLVLQLIGYFVAFIKNTSYVIGVVEVEDITTQASKEIARIED